MEPSGFTAHAEMTLRSRGSDGGPGGGRDSEGTTALLMHTAVLGCTAGSATGGDALAVPRARHVGLIHRAAIPRPRRHRPVHLAPTGTPG